jgi:hypothetical protein
LIILVRLFPLLKNLLLVGQWKPQLVGLYLQMSWVTLLVWLRHLRRLLFQKRPKAVGHLLTFLNTELALQVRLTL